MIFFFVTIKCSNNVGTLKHIFFEHIYELFSQIGIIDYIKKSLNELVRNSKSKKDRQNNGQNKRAKSPTMTNTALHRKLKIGQYEPNKKLGMNAGVPEWLAVPVSLVTPIACVFNDQ